MPGRYSANMKHIVIAGAGFGGVRLARNLRKYSSDVSVTLINDSDDFRYSPALYRAATGFKMGTARLPLEWMLLDSPNTQLEIGTVSGLDKKNNKIVLVDGREVTYDYAVFALGSVTTFFDIKGISENSFGIKTPKEVQELKDHMHSCLTTDNIKSQNFVVIGAGPTGVELSGALGAYAQHIISSHGIKNSNVEIFLIEAGPRILPQVSDKAATAAAKQLKKLGVKILTDTKVEEETTSQIITPLGNIHTHNVVWTAGTRNNPFFVQYPNVFKMGRGGKVDVNEHMEANKNIYVIGDNANTPHSGLALSAINHANYLSKELIARVRGRRRPTFKPKSPVKVIPAGENWAVLEHGQIVMHGRFISLIRRLADIVGYTDVLGPVKATTIWSSSNRSDVHCDICRR